MATSISLRIDLHSGKRFGPGKAALLNAGLENGSLSQAAKSLDMSYPRALKLTKQLNDSFSEPLILTTHGGANRGGAELTNLGVKLLEAYENARNASENASLSTLKFFEKYIKI